MKKNSFVLFSIFLIGALLGLSIFTFFYAEGLSYLSKRSEVCKNCHIMNYHYDSFIKSTHHHVATCSDCHLPQHFPQNLIVKAENGFIHSKAFTFQNFKEPIQIREKNRIILNKNCIRCHKELFSFSQSVDDEKLDCLHCHSNVGHGEKSGLGGPFKKEEMDEWKK